MKNLNLFVSIVIMSTFISSSLGWWDVGHMLTAEVARQELSLMNQTILDRCEQLVQSLNFLATNKSHTFVQSASWMDDIKNPPGVTGGMDFWDAWHFYDRPVNEDGLNILINNISNTYNSMDTLARALYVLDNDTGINSTERALFIRFVIHVIGDIHQPLHNTNFYNDTYSTGDMGGNLMNVTLLNGTEYELHGYWDAGAFIMQPTPEFIVRPLNDSSVEYMENWGTNLRKMYPRSYYGARLNMTNPMQWSEESYKLAKKYAYPLMSVQKSITEDYQNQTWEIVQQQVTLGGYRLADFIQTAFKNFTLPSISQDVIKQKSFLPMIEETQ